MALLFELPDEERTVDRLFEELELLFTVDLFVDELLLDDLTVDLLFTARFTVLEVTALEAPRKTSLAIALRRDCVLLLVLLTVLTDCVVVTRFLTD